MLIKLIRRNENDWRNRKLEIREIDRFKKKTGKKTES